MKFNETLLHSVLSFPKQQWEKDCAYIFILKIPVITLVMIIGITGSIILDFIDASFDVHDAQ